MPALGNSSVLGLDVPEGAGAVLADVTNAKQTDSWFQCRAFEAESGKQCMNNPLKHN